MLHIGTLVRMAESCICRDPRGCFHTPSNVVRIFKDGSAWIHNRQGYARRVSVDAIKVLGTTDRRFSK